MQSRLCKVAGRVVLSAVAGIVLLGMSQHAASAWGITWSDEFTGAASGAQPWSGNWNYETGPAGQNGEIETYVNSWANSHMIWDGTGTDSQCLQIEAQTDRPQPITMAPATMPSP